MNFKGGIFVRSWDPRDSADASAQAALPPTREKHSKPFLLPFSGGTGEYRFTPTVSAGFEVPPIFAASQKPLLGK
jgi:hypothetical protein